MVLNTLANSFLLEYQLRVLEQIATRPRGYKTFFMLNSAEHEILDTRKCKNIKTFGFFLGSDKPRMLFSPLINVKMPTIVGILTSMSRKNFMLC